MSIMNERVSYLSVTLALTVLLLSAPAFWDISIVGGDYTEHVLLAEHGVMGIMHVVVLLVLSVVVVFKWKNSHLLVIIIFVLYSYIF
jgi:asparagine N-glycosylation enzyme membrane subunit Stt3